MSRRILLTILIGLIALVLIVPSVLSSAKAIPSSPITIYPPNSDSTTGAHIPVVYGSSGDLELQFRTTGAAHVTNVVSDNPEWTAVDTNFTFETNYFPDVRFTPASAAGVSRATFSVYTDEPGAVYTFTVTGARVAEVSVHPTLFTLTSITLPVRLRINPVRNELYAHGWAGSGGPGYPYPQSRRLVRLSLSTRRETGVLELPNSIVDYGITQDGRWLYVITDYTLYTIDLNSFQIVSQFVPQDVNPVNAMLWRIGVFSNTLAYVSTNPYFASGGPVYQWNPQTNGWTATSLCDTATDQGSRAHLRVSADYSTISGLCDPYASPATTFLQRLGRPLETWKSEIRWATGISAHGDWALTAYFGSKWDGDFLVMHQGRPTNTYVHGTDRYSYGVAFSDKYDLAYGIVDTLNPPILEIGLARGVETRRIIVKPPRPLTYYESIYFPTMDDPALIKDDQLYLTLWYDYASTFTSGEVVAVPLAPYDELAPSSQVLPLPPFSPPTFNVIWSGSDNGPADIHTYDIQSRDGAAGVWTDWITDTVQTSAAFTGTFGHTYFFRSRARDWVGNLEAYPSGDGDTSTYIYRYQLAGYTLNTREQPIMMATVQASPAALNTAQSDPVGHYGLYFDDAGTLSLNASRVGFSSLPAMNNVIVTTTTTPSIFCLPPLDDAILNGGFETGDLSEWAPSGSVLPVITTTAHTGNTAVLMNGSDSRLEQTLVFSPTLPPSQTLSLLYQVVAGNPLSDTLNVAFETHTDTITFTLPLTPTAGWKHAWWELPAWDVPTGTLKIELASGDAAQPANVVFDEISLGDAAVGVYAVYLPVIAH